jgi:hypothetical protein
MSKKKGSKPSPQPQLSPRKYIMTKARGLPIYKCLINDNWKEELLAQVVVTRKHTNGNITGGIYVIDLLDRGLDDAVVVFNKPEEEFFEVLTGDAEGYEFEETSYEFAHNMIFQGVDFAEDQGFNPMKKLDLGAFILEEDTEAIDFVYIPFGEEAKTELVNNFDLDKFYSFSNEDWKKYFEENGNEISASAGYLDPFFEHVVLQKFQGFRVEPPFIVGDLDLRPDKEMMEVYAGEEKIRRIVDSFLDRLNDENTDFEQFEADMQKYSDQYPDNPLLKSFLATVVLQNDDTERFRELHEEILQSFPDYTHSRIMLAMMLLDDGDLEAYRKLMPEPFTPFSVFPEKKYFFHSEILALISSTIRYAVKINDLKLALTFEEILEDFSLLVEDVFVLQSNEILENALEEYNALKVEVCSEFVKNGLN